MWLTVPPPAAPFPGFRRSLSSVSCAVFFIGFLQPGLWKEGGVSRSLAGVVLDALNELDSDTRAEMLEDIVVVGGSAHLDGLGDRLEEDLKVRADYSSSTESTLVLLRGGTAVCRRCCCCCTWCGVALLLVVL